MELKFVFSQHCVPIGIRMHNILFCKHNSHAIILKLCYQHISDTNDVYIIIERFLWIHKRFSSLCRHVLFVYCVVFFPFEWWFWMHIAIENWSNYYKNAGFRFLLFPNKLFLPKEFYLVYLSIKIMSWFE